MILLLKYKPSKEIDLCFVVDECLARSRDVGLLHELTCCQADHWHSGENFVSNLYINGFEQIDY